MRHSGQCASATAALPGCAREAMVQDHDRLAFQLGRHHLGQMTSPLPNDEPPSIVIDFDTRHGEAAVRAYQQLVNDWVEGRR